ncbi:MAG: hypothetical protein JJU45_08210 [Acidimicrobiia bacterium]|nr:hypothetical protein [Acidimicrobiia bacterium]
MDLKLLIGGVVGVAVAAVLLVLDLPLVAIAVLVVGAGLYIFLRQRELRAEGALLADLDDDVFAEPAEDAAQEGLSTWSLDAPSDGLDTWDPSGAEAEPLGTWSPDSASTEEPLASFGGLDEFGGLGDAPTEGGTDLLDGSDLFDSAGLDTFEPEAPAATEELPDPFADGGSLLDLDAEFETEFGTDTETEPAAGPSGGLFSVPAPIDETVESDDDIMRASEATELAIDDDGGDDSELAKLLLKVQARLAAYE